MRKVAGSKFGRIGIVLGCAVISAALGIGVAGLLTSALPALAQVVPQTDSKGKPVDTAPVARGLRIYRDRANCASCHGWTGQGLIGLRPPSLIDTQLDKAGLVEVIACGRAGKTMPNHLAGSWTPAFPCYGGKLTNDIGEGQMPPKPSATMTMDEINDVADYIIAFYKGKPMSYLNCVAYFASSTVPECMNVMEELIDYLRN